MQWRVADNRITVYSSNGKYVLDDSGELVNKFLVTDEDKSWMRSAAWNDSEGSYVLSNIEVWFSTDAAERLPPTVLTAYYAGDTLIWEAEIPVGVCWLKPGTGDYVVAAGPQDLTGVAAGEEIWHLDFDQYYCFEPSLDADNNLWMVTDAWLGNYMLWQINRAGEIISQSKLPYTDKQMRFKFNPDSMLYAISPDGTVDLLDVGSFLLADHH